MCIILPLAILCSLGVQYGYAIIFVKSPILSKPGEHLNIENTKQERPTENSPQSIPPDTKDSKLLNGGELSTGKNTPSTLPMTGVLTLAQRRRNTWDDAKRRKRGVFHYIPNGDILKWQRLMLGRHRERGAHTSNHNENSHLMLAKRLKRGVFNHSPYGNSKQWQRLMLGKRDRGRVFNHSPYENPLYWQQLILGKRRNRSVLHPSPTGNPLDWQRLMFGKRRKGGVFNHSSIEYPLDWQRLLLGKREKQKYPRNDESKFTKTKFNAASRIY